MFKVTRFCVQPYVRRGGRLVPGDVQRFNVRPQADAAAALMRRRVAGVAVFRVSGWPVQDLWGEPELLWRDGEVAPPPYRRAAA